MNELISVIVPIYNVQDYLRRCLNSILGQTYCNLEILLIDDGSTDESGSIADEYAVRDSRVRVVHTENKGLSAARNYGIRWAKGTYLAFIDSDDYVLDNFLERLYDLNQKYNAQISVCDYVRNKKNKGSLNEYKGKVECLSSEEWLSEWHGKRKKLETVVWNKLYHKDIFENEAEIFPVGQVHEDIETEHLLIARSRKVVFTTEKLYVYLQRENSLTHRKISQKDMQDLLNAQEKRLSFFNDRGYEKAYERLLTGSQKYRIRNYCLALEVLRDSEWAEEERKIFNSRYSETKKFRENTIFDRCGFALFYYRPVIVKNILKILKVV